MTRNLILQTFAFGDTKQALFVPDAEVIQQLYSDNKDAAYWAKVWPAAIGLCQFLEKHPVYITGKTILELAAGLGLPGLYAAGLAKQVFITDREEKAVACIQQSITHLQLVNVQTTVLDWKDSTHFTHPDVVILSDVNYEPAVFEELQEILTYFIQHNIPVIISTPQRLVARLFVNNFLPHSTQQWNSEIVMDGKATGVSVYVLNKS